LKSYQCPKCGSKVKKFWNNPVGGIVVGRCETCRKLVNLGKTEGPTAAATAEAGQAAPPQKKEVKKAPRASARGKSKRAARPQPAPAPAPAAKRAGVRGALADFFEW
jgi:predicted RNA-binding Zn-ribbon protein involved in translation (DUF1610 family)